MARRLRVLAQWMVVLGASGWLFQAGCARNIERELEVLVVPGANGALIHSSYLVDLFGPRILELFTGY
jgi:hypothetical protein